MDIENVTTHLFLCHGKSCTKNGADEVTRSVRETIYEYDLTDKIHTTKTMCNGQCSSGPIVISYPQGVWYQKMNTTMGKELIRSIKRAQPFKEKCLYTLENGRFRKLSRED
ncbi:ferredoxin [Alteribacillus sp. HJP-4]|uniref:(2Fe-2S) ferredoxin domain-containing protein n=1 Tax=Alteribacillus sp. HJP-4 TaxID=2775394 RepID=UPI0035CCF4B0